MSKPSQPSGETAAQRDQRMSQTDSGEDSSRPSEKEIRHGRARRRVLQSIAAGGATITVKALPEQWAKPVLDTAVLPVHAQSTCQAETLNCAVNTMINNAGDANPNTDFPVPCGGSFEVDRIADTQDLTVCGNPPSWDVYTGTMSFVVSATVNPPCEPVDLDTNLTGSDNFSLGSGSSQSGVVDPDSGAVAFNNVQVLFALPEAINDPESEDYAATMVLTFASPGAGNRTINISFTESFRCIAG